ncbi:MAG0490 family ComEA-like DNA-binding protein [Mycoplasma sp. Sp48II]|uniref:MAG0490 family ComEA-like DNA-binding protein n=1 Tax=unclassified Mycoplasma TaxID=2683645 RepID=UPI003A83BE65
MQKKKIWLYLIGLSLAGAISGFVLSQRLNQGQISEGQDKKDKPEKIYHYRLSGNILHTHIESLAPLTYRELFFLAQAKTGSKFDKFKLDEYADDKKIIFVPKYDWTLYWSDIKSMSDFIAFGIDKKYAKILFEYHEKHKQDTVTWKDVESIKGIGYKTFLKLKKFLILE